MTEPLDRALRALNAEPPGCALDALEPLVWRRIEEARQARRAATVFFPVRAAAVVGALAFGVAIGGVSAGDARAERQEVSVFSVNAGLAPSTLLESR